MYRKTIKKNKTVNQKNQEVDSGNVKLIDKVNEPVKDGSNHMVTTFFSTLSQSTASVI